MSKLWGSGIVSGVTAKAYEDVNDTGEMIRAYRSALNTGRPAAPVLRPVAVPPAANKPEPQAIRPAHAAPAEPLAPAPNHVRAGIGKRHVLSLMAATVAGMLMVAYANQSFAPEMYADGGMVPAAQAHAEGLNYAVFDLNLNIRALRDEQLKRMTKTPELILLGASHWQEAHKDLLPGYDYYNAHIHRDYWEDIPGMVELLTRNNRLPKKLIISIRDLQFTPVVARKDYLWEPGIPAYRDMAARLGLEAESLYQTLPYNRVRALISLPMLFTDVTRWYNADEIPHSTDSTQFKSLDVLLPDGSIMWSENHKHIFTQERTRRESLTLAAQRESEPPQIDPKGVEAFGATLDFLKQKGVEVYLVHPPFNPIYYDAIQGKPYAEGLKEVEQLTQRMAQERGLKVFGSFNPHEIGCTADMYIDAEHSNPQCLKKLFDQFMAIDKAGSAS